MKSGSAFLILILLVLWSSCRSDLEPEASSGRLEFSRDTVFLDTVFSNLSTSTYSLKVYNRSGEDIYIPEISLEAGENSLYRLNVDGIPGKTFENVEILARDSIYIFIETTVPTNSSNPSEFLYIDKLNFISEGTVQKVPLVTLVKDATFLFPPKDGHGVPMEVPIGLYDNGEPLLVTGFMLQGEHLELTGNKPFVIYGYAVVPEGETLKIDAGARLHFHSNSGIVVSKNASIQVKGAPSMDPEKREKEVIFQSDRLESSHEDIPGQWGTIWLQKGSGNHLFEHVTIKNSEVGIFAEGTENSLTSVELLNVQVYNSAVSGMYSENARITAKNLVINNSGRASLHLRGGQYNFIHATIANYWQLGYREVPALLLENVSGAGPAPLSAEFHNSIVFGNGKKELLFNAESPALFEIYFSHSLLKFEQNSDGGLYDFNNELLYNNIWLNESPLFVAPEQNNFQLRPTSAAIDRGNLEAAKLVPLDLLGNGRTPAPDLGAYEFVEPLE